MKRSISWHLAPWIRFASLEHSHSRNKAAQSLQHHQLVAVDDIQNIALLAPLIPVRVEWANRIAIDGMIDRTARNGQS